HVVEDVLPRRLSGLEGVEEDVRGVVALGRVRARFDAVLGLPVGPERALGLVTGQARAGDDGALGLRGAGALRERRVIDAVAADELGGHARTAHLLEERGGLVHVAAIEEDVRTRLLPIA